MKLNKETLKQIIKEELDALMREDDIYDDDSGPLTPYQMQQSPVRQLDKNPEMDVDKLVAILLGKDQLGHPHPGIGGFGDYDTNMYDLRTFIKNNPDDPRAKKIIQAL